MVTTSIEASSQKLSGTRPAVHDGTVCETCRAPVDLTASVLMKGRHIVGCPGCDWGAGSTFSYAPGSRASAARTSLLRALG